METLVRTFLQSIPIIRGMQVKIEELYSNECLLKIISPNEKQEALIRISLDGTYSYIVENVIRERTDGETKNTNIYEKVLPPDLLISILG